MASAADSKWTGDPNSGNQRWSKWTFTFVIPGKQPSVDYVRDNARRFFTKMFQTTAGAVRVTQIGRRWHVELRVEGVAVHDPGVRRAAERQFDYDFVRKGFRGASLLAMEAGLLAGTREDGTPRDHLIVMPTLSLKELADGE